MATKGIIIGLEGTTCAVRVVPHKTDETKLALKSQNFEAAYVLAQILDLDDVPGEGFVAQETFKGSTYFITIVEKAAFLENIHKVFSKGLFILNEVTNELADGN